MLGVYLMKIKSIVIVEEPHTEEEIKNGTKTQTLMYSEEIGGWRSDGIFYPRHIKLIEQFNSFLFRK